MKVKEETFMHPQVKNISRVTDEVLNADVLLHFPYHSFDPVIDLLREAAIDPDVSTIKITAYRLADNSKVINALINAVRNGKDVTVLLELRERFDEENNLYWKQVLEDEGVKVLLGEPNQKACQDLPDQEKNGQQNHSLWVCKHGKPERKYSEIL
jgi:polyphosphate kinase